MREVTVHEVTVHGESGPPVLLLPGGAESSEDFFPGLIEGLLADPGCRVICYDRPGTGRSGEPGLLADAAADLNELIAELHCGPVVVVGQSLGGAVALLLARDFPQSVAGLVLLDPTPINGAAGCARLEKTLAATRALCRVPFVEPVLQAGLRLGMIRSLRRAELRPDCRAAIEKIGNLDITQLADAVTGIGEISANFRESELPQTPAVLITADRKPTHSIARSHARLAAGLGVRAQVWPNAAHNLHLDHPDETLTAVRELVARTGGRS